MDMADITAWISCTIDESCESSRLLDLYLNHTHEVISAVFFVMVGWETLTDSNASLAISITIWLGASALLYLTLSFVSRRISPRELLLRSNIRNRKKAPQWQHVFDAKSLILEQDGILQESVNFRNRVPWADIRQIEEKDDYIYIRLVDPMKGRYLIPKKAFNDAGHAMAFLDEARTLWIAAVGKH
jgi:hypothetical protein